MKKLIINFLGIGSVLTLLTMIVMTVCGATNETSSERAVSSHDRAGRLGNNIKPQNVVTNKETYSSSSNLTHVYASSGKASSKKHDPTDYCDEVLFETGSIRNQIDNYKDAEAADVIE
jgi:predicted small secreted protein